MRPFRVSCMTVILLLVCNTCLAQGMDDCRLTCAREKDTSNGLCPPVYYDDPDSAKSRDQCLKNNQQVYFDCIKQCPAPPTSPGPSGGPPPSSPPMGY